MHYVFIDDSVPFDGYTSARRPLGGAEKAFASLAAATAGRGHTVTVLNRTPYPVIADGVRYRSLEDLQSRPLDADVVIAFRQPVLLGTVRKAKHRLLWAVAAPDYLKAGANASYWESFKPTLLFARAVQERAYDGPLPHRLLVPGVRPVFFTPAPAFEPPVPPEPLPPEPALPEAALPEAAIEASPAPPAAPAAPSPKPPHVIVTTHPLHGLAWLTEIWRRLIQPQVPEARMAVYSAILAKGLRDEPVPEPIQPVLARVKSAADANVVVVDPLGDDGMAAAYRASRIHFYPGHPQDFACWTLAESQAAGTPAVARPVGGVDERVVNGQTGFLVPDATAFGNVATELLRNDSVHASFSTAAAEVTRRRTWDMAAAELDQIVAEL